MKYVILSHWHDDVIKWKYFQRYWPFLLGIHRSPVNSPHKGQWRGALMLSLICTWIKSFQVQDLRRYSAHYDVTVMRHGHMAAIDIFNSSLPGKMATFFADDIFKWTFLNENDRIRIQISLKYFPKSPVDNKAALVEIKAWRRIGDKPLSEPMLTRLVYEYIQH